MVKALRNFVHPLLKSKQTDTKGVDNRLAAVEAVGDMFMYCCSLYRSLGIAKFVDPQPVEYVTAELGVAAIAIAVGHLLRANVDNGLYRTMELVNCIAGLANTCCIDPFEAVKVSLEKLK